MSSVRLFPYRDRAASTVRPRARLLCLPFAGGSAAAYRGWSALLPDIDVCALELPGRGARFGDVPADDPAPLVAELSHALAPLADVPLVVFGHSMGGRLGFALVRAGLPAQGLIVAASRPPSARETPRALDDEAIVRAMKAYGGTPAEVFEDAELLALFLPLLRADFRLHDHLVSDDVVHVPITHLAAPGDRHLPFAEADGWRRHTTAGFALETMPGDHFFVASAPEAVTRVIARVVASVL